jgi:hypothetical protein
MDAVRWVVVGLLVFLFCSWLAREAYTAGPLERWIHRIRGGEE